VFRAEGPQQLCGYHPQLIGLAAAAGEPFQYLLYSPICDGTDGPFRVGGASGSHAVGITPRRLLVSRDPHADRPPRSVLKIDLGAVAALEIGCALALGWFVVRYAGSQGPGSCPVTFGSPGICHFREVVRAYRRLAGHAHVPSDAGLEWPAVWEGVPAYIRSEVEPLTEPPEPALAVLRSPERWTFEKRLLGTRPVCVSAPGLLVVTSRGLLHAASEPRLRPGGLRCGVNVTVVRPNRVREASIGTRGDIGFLRLRAGEPKATHELDVPFDPADVAVAEEIVHLARAWRDAT
jgi:hypothetical protein